MIHEERITTLMDFMRHGEPVGGIRYRGHIDDPLSSKGLQDMCAAIGSKRPWDSIVSSPLSRCLAFAEHLSEASGLPLEIDERFKEIGFGAWQDKIQEEMTQYDHGLLQRFYRDPTTYRPDGAEGLAEFRARIISGVSDLLSRHSGKHLLIISHAGVIRMVLGHILDIPFSNLFRIKVANARITRVEYAEQGEEFLGQLIFHGGTL